jgi:carbamoyl-phosphate synthase large subunit
MVIAGKKDLQQYFASQLYRPQDVILQEYIEGDEYTVSAVAGSRGDLYAVVPKRIIHKQGVTYLSVTEKNSAIEKIVEKIQSVFKADGPFNVQLKMVRGQPCVLEVNPRFSTTVTHTMAAGVDEVTLLIKDFLGRPVGPRPKGFRDQLVMIRHLTQQYLPVGELK